MTTFTELIIWIYVLPMLSLIPIYHLSFKKTIGKAHQSQFKGIAIIPIVNFVLVFAFVIAYTKYLIDLLFYTMKKK